MKDYLIRPETLSSSLEVAGEKISQKLLVSIVLKGLRDSFEYFKTVHDFFKTPTPFSDLKKALKYFADSQKLKEAGRARNSKSETTLLVSEESSKKISGKCFRCQKIGHMQNSCEVKQCSICKKFGHVESKCFQKSKSENTANFSQGYEFSFIGGYRESKICELSLDCFVTKTFL